MRYASTFLSHSSTDKPLVEAVACELGKRGVVAWLDKNELLPGVNLDRKLRQAIVEQTSVTLFLSSAAIASAWVTEELSVALALEKQLNDEARIIPIFLEDALPLVSSHPLLTQRWLTRDATRVRRFGIDANQWQDPETRAAKIAVAISQNVYHTLELPTANSIAIYIDQRGTGQKKGIPSVTIPERLESDDLPCLVFRPDLEPRRKDATLTGEKWTVTAIAMQESLAEALDGVKWADRKEVHILGFAQLAFSYLLGTYFDRHSKADLYCTQDKYTFSNEGQLRDAPLMGGNPNCDSDYPGIVKIQPGDRCESIALFLGQENLVPKVKEYLDFMQSSIPLVWVSNSFFTDSEEVLEHVKDILALLDRLKRENGLNHVQLFCGLPFNAVPILAANLLHVVDNIEFMEYRRDLQGTQNKDIYSSLISP